MQSNSDQHIVHQVLQGKQNAFVHLIQIHERSVRYVISSFIKNEEERKDVFQEVFLKVHRNLSSFKYQSKLSTWISRIAHNYCLNYIRDNKKRKNNDSLDEYAESFEHGNHPSVRDNKDASSIVIQQEKHDYLNACIELLPDKYKLVINLYHKQELSYEEISKITDLPKGTLKTNLFRARKLLKDKMLESYGSI